MIAGKYVLDRLLGQGGMGAVFAARHVKLSKAVAIKIMLADASNPEAAQRFINEGRAAANIQNEHVVRVDDVDEEMGYAYMVLELLDGEDLSQVLERELSHRLAPHVAVGYVLEALRGVLQAHAIGIVHRDLKPSNLFLARRKDGTVVVKVLDFGISKAQGSSALAASPSALTSTKTMLGSPLYMSPEQLRNAKGVDHRADIWAMGVILYELITGTLPFNGENLGELFANILERDADPMASRVDGIARGLDDVVARCLQRRPDQRYQSTAELAHALAPFAAPHAGQALMPATGPMSNLAGTAALPQGAITPNGTYQQSRPQSSAGFPAQSASQPLAYGAISSGPTSSPQPGYAGQPTHAQNHSGLQGTTNGGWQTAGGSGPAQAPARSKGLLLAGLGFGAIALIGVVLIALKVLGGAKPMGPSAASSDRPPTSATPIIASTTPPPPEVGTATATAPSASASAVAVVSSVPVTPPPPHTAHVTPPATPKVPGTGSPTPPPPPTGKKPPVIPGVENTR